MRRVLSARLVAVSFGPRWGAHLADAAVRESARKVGDTPLAELESTGRDAGRITLQRLSGPEAQRKSFAFESTLASQGLARRLARLKQSGYRVHILICGYPLRTWPLPRAGGADEPIRVRNRQVWRIAAEGFES